MNLQSLALEFRDKRIFLTGHTGFKGGWLLYTLAQFGAQVRGYALPPVERSLYERIDGDQFCDSMLADVRDAARLQEAVEDFQPDYIFHFAAQTLVRESYYNPLDTFSTNVMGTANLLNAVRSVSGQCTVVVITSDKVYENQEWIYPYRETDQLGGFDPYSASKSCADLAVNSFRRSYFNLSDYDTHQTAIATARAGNVIGGGDWNTDQLVPDIVDALHLGVPVKIRSPNAVRPWQHVLEAIFGYLKLASALREHPNKFSEAFNFGPDVAENVSVEAFVKQAIRVWGHGDYEANPATANLHEATLLRLDSSKAQTFLGWYPVFNADQAIARTIEWYRDLLRAPDSALELMERDFKAYTAAVDGQ
ncbi:MAG: CDP-glucose 4,6-dehydratase [Thiotrichales bacterium]